MDLWNQLLLGFATAATPINLLWCLVGCAIGTAVGVLPGIGPAVAVAMLLPITSKVDATASMIFFARIYYGARASRPSSVLWCALVSVGVRLRSLVQTGCDPSSRRYSAPSRWTRPHIGPGLGSVPPSTAAVCCDGCGPSKSLTVAG